MKITLRGRSYEVDVMETGESTYRVKVDGTTYDVTMGEDAPTITDAEQSSDKVASIGEGTITSVAAPLPGKVTGIEVREGDSVSKGQPLVILESMKMNVPVKATRAGTVAQICVAIGENLVVGHEVALIE